MRQNGKFEKQPRKSRGGKVTLIVLVVVLAVILAAVGGFLLYYNHMLGKLTQVEADPSNVNYEELDKLMGPPIETETEPEETEAPTEETTVPTEPPVMTADDIVNILLVGNSSRKGEEALLADTTIIVSINKFTNTVTLTSVFRDSYVLFPTFVDPNGKSHGGGHTKFTMCYNLGYKYGNNDIAWAMEVTNLTLLENFGVEIDYDFEVNFDGFIALIDKLGGVSLELTEAEAKYINKSLKGYCEMVPGENEVDGYIGLTYARMRHADGDGDSDIKRTRRQRYLIEQVINKLRYTDVATINAVFNEVLPYITTNMPTDEINKLLLELIPMLPDLKVESGTCPAEGTYGGRLEDIFHDGQEQSIVTFDSNQQKKIMRAITEGEIPEETTASK